jgi:hypothetical protein
MGNTLNLKLMLAVPFLLLILTDMDISIFMTEEIFHLLIFGIVVIEKQFLNILLRLFTSLIFHLEISGKNNKDSQPQNKLSI